MIILKNEKTSSPDYSFMQT